MVGNGDLLVDWQLRYPALDRMCRSGGTIGMSGAGGRQTPRLRVVGLAPRRGV